MNITAYLQQKNNVVMHARFAIFTGTIHSPSRFVTVTGLIISGANRFNAYEHAKYNIRTDLCCSACQYALRRDIEPYACPIPLSAF